MAHWLALCPNSIFLRRLFTERIFTEILVTFVSKSKFTWYHSCHEYSDSCFHCEFMFLKNLLRMGTLHFT